MSQQTHVPKAFHEDPVTSAVVEVTSTDDDGDREGFVVSNRLDMRFTGSARALTGAS